jgi:hypothetical protein
MKKRKLLLLMFLLAFLTLSTLLLMNTKAITTKTTVTASPLDDVQVDQVDHIVKILAGGSITINDTVRLSAKPGKTVTLANYSLGFPYGYKNSLANVYAFNASNPLQTLKVLLDTGVGTSIGFYGVTVIFPQPGVHLSNGESFSFTVIYVFSNTMISSTYTYRNVEQIPPTNVTVPVLTVDFPIYPSLPQNATVANVTVICPPQTNYEISSSNLKIKSGNSDTGQILNLTAKSLGAFTYLTSWLNLTETTSGEYRIVTFDNIGKQLQIDGQDNIFVTDTYTITSQMLEALQGFRLNLLKGARNVSASDAKGTSLTVALTDANTTTYSVSGFSLQQGQSTQFKLTYYLSGSYLTKTGTNSFNLDLPITKGFDRVAGELTLVVSLPEGVSITEYPNLNYDLQNNAFQQEITLTAYNVSLYDNIDLQLSYVYSVFWASFRPTLWMTAIVTVGMVIALFWRAQKPTAPVSIPSVATKPQSLKALVSSYEERTKALLELESLERQAQKGRIPRRRYKVRKRMLESQIYRLDRELVDLKQRAKSMGSRYAEILKDLEIAEAELEGIEVEERRTMARYRAGAYTLDAYRRMQEQYNKRRERAKATIEGALLRLSEGIA